MRRTTLISNRTTGTIASAEDITNAALTTAVHRARHNLAEARRATRMQQLDDEAEHAASVATHHQSALLRDTLERLRQIAQTHIPEDDWLYAQRIARRQESSNNPNVSRPF